MPFLTLLKLIPIRDWLYAAITIAAVIWFLHHDHVERNIGAARITAAVQVATAKAQAAAQKKIDSLNVTHADDVAQIEDQYEKAIRDNDASHATDLQRLRNRAARDSPASQVLDGSKGGEATGKAGTGSVASLGSVPAELTLNMADALRADDAALDKCYADRDGLTGK